MQEIMCIIRLNITLPDEIYKKLNTKSMDK